MEKKRTNKIYNVQLAKYAVVAVEARSTNDAKKKAILYLSNGTISRNDIDAKFEESDVYFDACSPSSSCVDEYNKNTIIYTDDGEKRYDDYVNELEAQEK